MTDVEEEKGKIRVIRLGEEKVYSLAYTDDVILITKEEREIKSIMGRRELFEQEEVSVEYEKNGNNEI